MKIRRTFFLPGIIILFSMGCMEDIPVDNNRFVKIYGKESGSFGNALYEYPNGEILIGGKVDVPALDFINTGGVLSINKVIEGSIALIHTNNNGNQIKLNAFPIDNYPTQVIEFPNIDGKARIDQILPTDDGGFMLLCQWRGMDISVPHENFYIEGDHGSTTPFLVKMNSNNYPEFIRSFNGENDWDSVYRARAVMKKFPDGDFGFLFGVNSYGLEADDFLNGYSFLKLTQTGDTVLFNDFFDDRFFPRSAADFIIDNRGGLTILGQTGPNLQIMRRDFNRIGIEEWVNLDLSGIFGGGWNNNPMFIKEFSDGNLVTVYTNPPSQVRVKFVSANWSMGEPFIINKRDNEYPRAVHITKNEDILIYTEHLSNTTVPEGYLYRIDRNGKTIFRIKLEGTPGDVIEANDGTILVLSNPLFNGLIPKTRMTKISSDGKLF